MVKIARAYNAKKLKLKNYFLSSAAHLHTIDGQGSWEGIQGGGDGEEGRRGGGIIGFLCVNYILEVKLITLIEPWKMMVEGLDNCLEY